MDTDVEPLILDPTKIRCKACDKEWADHPGVEPTCAELQSYKNLGHSPTWPYIIKFALMMEAKLANDRANGLNESWQGADQFGLANLMFTELKELCAAMEDGDNFMVQQKTASVSNYAMFISDWHLHRLTKPNP